MVKKFVTNRLARIRRARTGEAHSEAAPAIAAAVGTLSSVEQRQLAAFLHADAQAARRWGTDVTPVPAHVRHALLADATAVSQQELESGLFLAAASAAAHLRYRLPANLLAPNRVVHAFAPRSHKPGEAPTVHLHDFALGPLLFELLPNFDGTDVHGIPGLRHRQHSHSVELYLLDAPDARLVLAGINRRCWTDALAFVEYATAVPTSWFNQTHPGHLTRQEQEHLETRPRVFGAAALASALLRRIRVLDGACEIQIDPGRAMQTIRWTGGPACNDVAASLLDPIFGLPGAFEPEWLRFESARLRQHHARHDAADQPNNVELSLRRDASPSHETVQRFRSQAHAWEENPWRIWETSVVQTLNKSRTTRSASTADPVLQRAARTGEALASAAYAMGPDRVWGPDDCSQAQRQLRALLAVHVFNAGQIGAPPKRTSTHTITAYSLVVSPRLDDLVLFTNAPDNLVGYLARQAHTSSGIPGMRLESRPNASTFHLIHVPTGGRLTVTSRDEHDIDTIDETSHWPHRDWLPADVPTSRRERTELASIPPMSDDTTRLLAGLVVRIGTKDPHGRWAVGNWAGDPLRRTPRPTTVSGDATRALWGANNDWDLQWDGYPYSDDVVRSLTDPVIGMAGVDVTGSDQIYDVTLNDAVVSLRPWYAAAVSNRMGARG